MWGGSCSGAKPIFTPPVRDRQFLRGASAYVATSVRVFVSIESGSVCCGQAVACSLPASCLEFLRFALSAGPVLLFLALIVMGTDTDEEAEEEAVHDSPGGAEVSGRGNAGAPSRVLASRGLFLEQVKDVAAVFHKEDDRGLLRSCCK